MVNSANEKSVTSVRTGSSARKIPIEATDTVGSVLRKMGVSAVSDGEDIRIDNWFLPGGAMVLIKISIDNQPAGLDTAVSDGNLIVIMPKYWE